MLTDRTPQNFDQGDAGVLAQRQASGRLIDEATDAVVATMPSFAFAGDVQAKKTAEDALAVPAAAFASDLAAIASMQNNKYGRNGTAILDAFQTPTATGLKTDEAVLTNIGESRELVANVHNLNAGRFSDPNFRNNRNV